MARALGCRLMRASVKEDVNVGAVFRALAARCLADMRREDAAENGLPVSVAPVIGRPLVNLHREEGKSIGMLRA